MSLAAAPRVWFRRLADAGSRRSAEERWAFALLLLGFAILWLGGGLAPLAQAALWAGFLGLVAVLARGGRFHLLGPVFGYELVRMARRRRYFWFRTLYALVLFGLLGWVYLIWTLEIRPRYGRVRPADMAVFASAVFYGFMGIQYVLVVLLTPLYTAGTIAEEKDRKTMEFVLATDLRDQEIVLGKWLARLGNLTLLVLAGLPLLSFVQFLGGIDPDLLLAGFAATGLTMLSLGALGMLCSVFARKARDAIILTYLLAALYHLLSGATWLVLLPITGRRGDTSIAELLDFLPWDDIVHWLNAGNIFSAMGRLLYAFEFGGRIDAVLPELLRLFTVFHVLATGVFLAWAVLRLRAVALRQAHAPARRWFAWRPLRKQAKRLPPVGAQPVLWKEVHVDRGFVKLYWVFRVGIGLLVVGSFVPAFFICMHYLFWGPSWPRYNAWDRLGRDMNVWVRLFGTGAACLLLLAVAVRAAASISGERDKQTFDGLITTQLNGHDILFGKWLGSILSVRWGWLWLGAIWGIGLLTGGLHPLGLPLLPLTWLVYAAVFATIGVWFSMNSATTMRATIGTLLTVVVIGGGHWLVMGLFCYLPLDLMRVRGRDMEPLLFFHLGQTPPAVLAFEAVHGRDLERLVTGQFRGMRSDHVQIAFFSLVGVVSWAFLALFLWRRVSRRFRQVVGLTPLVTSRPQPFSASAPSR